MCTRPEFNVEMTEVHHIHKLDAPSGTAITLAEDILQKLPGKDSWVNDKTPQKNEINIQSERRGEVPGIHTIKYESEVDFIEIKHETKNRKGLATGAVLAAEYCRNHKGILTMKDLLNI